MLGPYWIPAREDLVTEIEDQMIISSLNYDYSVVVDATNFKTDRFIKLALNNRAEFILKPFTDVSLEECIERDSKRTWDKVGGEVIKNMWNKYLK
jgi:predicted kinase